MKKVNKLDLPFSKLKWLEIKNIGLKQIDILWSRIYNEGKEGYLVSKCKDYFYFGKYI